MACCAGHDSEDEDIAAQLGAGSLMADVELDALKDAAEGEILAMLNLVGRYAPLLVAHCHNRCYIPLHCFHHNLCTASFLKSRFARLSLALCHLPHCRQPPCLIALLQCSIVRLQDSVPLSG